MITVVVVVGLVLLLGALANDPDRPRTPRRERRKAGRARPHAVPAAGRAGGARLRDSARAWRANTAAGRRLHARTAAARGARGMFWPAERTAPPRTADGPRVNLRKPARTPAAAARPARAAVPAAQPAARPAGTAQFGGHMETLKLAQAADALAGMPLPAEGLTGLAAQVRAVAVALARVQAGLSGYVDTIDTEAQLDPKVMGPLWQATDLLADAAVLVAEAGKKEELIYGAHHDAADSGLPVRPDFALPQTGGRR